jgi:hypothetical protein
MKTYKSQILTATIIIPVEVIMTDADEETWVNYKRCQTVESKRQFLQNIAIQTVKQKDFHVTPFVSTSSDWTIINDSKE